MSAPGENAYVPAPRNTRSLTTGSAARRFMSAAMSRQICKVMAFRLAGRLITTCTMDPSCTQANGSSGSVTVVPACQRRSVARSLTGSSVDMSGQEQNYVREDTQDQDGQEHRAEKRESADCDLAHGNGLADPLQHEQVHAHRRMD